jgi:hypothetical protein
MQILEQISARLFAKFVVEQDHVDGRCRHDSSRFRNGGAVPHNAEASFHSKQSNETLPEQCVVINQKDMHASAHAASSAGAG